MSPSALAQLEIRVPRPRLRGRAVSPQNTPTQAWDVAHNPNNRLCQSASVRFRLGWCVAVLAAVCGCGDGLPPRYPVSGIVTYHNQPVAGAQVMFTSAAGRAAEGTTDADGKFALTTYEPGDGAFAGSHRVTIVKMISTNPADPYAAAKNALPARYASAGQSPLEVTVSATEPNEFRFDLTDR